MEATTLSRKRIFHGKRWNAWHSVRHGARRQVAPHANFVDFGGNRQSPEAQRNGTTAHHRQKTHHLSVVSRRIARLKGKWGRSSKRCGKMDNPRTNPHVICSFVRSSVARQCPAQCETKRKQTGPRSPDSRSWSSAAQSRHVENACLPVGDALPDLSQSGQLFMSGYPRLLRPSSHSQSSGSRASPISRFGQ